MSVASVSDPAERAIAVTPSDTTVLSPAARSLYVGGAGNVAVVTTAGDTVTFVGASAGGILPVQCAKVLSTGTTATSIVSLS